MSRPIRNGILKFKYVLDIENITYFKIYYADISFCNIYDANIYIVFIFLSLILYTMSLQQIIKNQTHVRIYNIYIVVIIYFLSIRRNLFFDAYSCFYLLYGRSKIVFYTYIENKYNFCISNSSLVIATVLSSILSIKLIIFIFLQSD